MSPRPLIALAIVAVSGCTDTERVGPIEGGGHRVATGQLVRPEGAQVEWNGRPVDLAISPDGEIAFVKDHRGLVVVDLRLRKVRQELSIPGGASQTGIELAPDGSVWLSNAGSRLVQCVPDAGGKYRLGATIDLPRPKAGGEAYGTGLAMTRSGKAAWVCLSRANALVKVDLRTRSVSTRIAVDIAPFDLALNSNETEAYVACWGGRPPRSGDRMAKSSGSDVKVDERGVAVGGTLQIVDLASRKSRASVSVGLQPSALFVAENGGAVFVANANSDTVSEIDLRTRRLRRLIPTRPSPRLLFGSAPNAIAATADGKRLFVALGGNNAVAVIDLGRSPRITGLIPAGWYPCSLALSKGRLVIANAKGVGSRGGSDPKSGRSVYDFRGSLGIVPIPSRQALTIMTLRAQLDSRVPEALRALDRPKAKTAPKPVPDAQGEPSTIEHVVYILKENRTYDQLFGDLQQGDGDPSLCMFGREITPNHHALAEEFVLLDNYYCNGVNSADGHAWAVEGNASSHLERSFGGWTRSYPFGDDPLSTSSSGFIWDNVLAHGLTFRNYGEFDYAEPVPDAGFKEIYDDFIHRTGKFTFKRQIGVERARLYANPKYPGWNMKIPDVLRASVFIEELREFEKSGSFPSFTLIYLPQDHNSGTSPGMPTPRAHMADNDLALGRIVEALSRSRFWRKMAIFVNEDDPQGGFDHVDGHRSICLVISPYAKRGEVVSRFYNQTSVLHTMERILGIPPMNQMDAMAPLMSECFRAGPDFTPYTSLPANVPLDELNPAKSELRGAAARWAEMSAQLDLSRPDAGDDDLRNRILWFSVRGEEPYPAKYAGAHGRGLKARRLSHDGSNED
jgi:DNA-binding beta-propeller fold protein YncE